MRIAVVNLKGGAGKTTTAFFLATALGRRGSTLLVDSDPQASSLSWSEAAEADGAGELPFTVAGLPTKDVHKKLRKLGEGYEHIVLDTPPGELAIARAALMAAEVAVVTLSPSVMDVDRLRPTLELISEVEGLNDLSYYVLLTRVRRISREGRDARAAMEDLELPVLQAEIPLLGFYADSFAGRVEDLGDYEAVADELLEAEVTV